MRGEERAERRASGLLLALEQTDDVDRRAVARPEPRVERCDVCEQLALVVGSAAADEAVADSSRPERGRDPRAERIRRLNVVVPIDEDRRRVSAPAPPRNHDRVAGRRYGGCVRETDAAEGRREPVGARADVASMRRLCTDARELDEAGERVRESRHVPASVGNGGVGAHESVLASAAVAAASAPSRLREPVPRGKEEAEPRRFALAVVQRGVHAVLAKLRVQTDRFASDGDGLHGEASSRGRVPDGGRAGAEVADDARES